MNRGDYTRPGGLRACSNSGQASGSGIWRRPGARMLTWVAHNPSACPVLYLRLTPSDAKPTSKLKRAAESNEYALILFRLFSAH